MPERDPIERLNEALKGLAIEGGAPPDRDIGGLIAVALRLYRMPRKHFECDSELNWRSLAGAALLDVQALAGEFRRERRVYPVNGSRRAGVPHASEERFPDPVPVAPGAVTSRLPLAGPQTGSR